MGFGTSKICLSLVNLYFQGTTSSQTQGQLVMVEFAVLVATFQFAAQHWILGRIVKVIRNKQHISNYRVHIQYQNNQTSICWQVSRWCLGSWSHCSPPWHAWSGSVRKMVINGREKSSGTFSYLTSSWILPSNCCQCHLLNSKTCQAYWLMDTWDVLLSRMSYSELASNSEGNLLPCAVGEECRLTKWWATKGTKDMPQPSTGERSKTMAKHSKISQGPILRLSK